MSLLTERADTIEQCEKKIYKHFQKNRVTILTQRVIKTGGFLGLFQKDGVEITFNYNEDPSIPDEVPSHTSELAKRAMSKIDELNAASADGYGDSLYRQTNLSPYINEPVMAEVRNGKIEQQKAETIEMLQTSVATLADRLSQLNASGIVNERTSFKKLRAILEVNAFSPDYIRTVFSDISKKISVDQENNFELLQQLALDRIAQSIKVTSLTFPENKSEETWNLNFSLVGPTGVGKTTTVAKLCAYFFLALAKKLKRKFRVSAITIDNYRIGGWEQIKKYSEHMRIPLTIATTPTELKTAVAEGKGRYDVTFIDTSGRSPNDKEKISDMTKYFEGIEKDVCFFLTMSASTQPRDVENIIKAYEPFGYSSIIITKTDEASYIGGLISALDKTDIPISYICTGQDVPKDIERANKVFFLKKLIGFDSFTDYIDAHFLEGTEGAITWE